MLSRVEIRRLTWPLQNIPLFYLQKLLGCFCCMFGSLSTCMKHHQSPLLHLTESGQTSLYTSEFFRLLLSSVTSSLNTSNPVSLEAMHGTLMPSWAVPSLLHTYIFSSCHSGTTRYKYLLWWSLLLIVDFDSDTPTSWRVFFSWLDVLILRLSTTVVLRGRPGLFILLSSPVHSFFSECTKLLIWSLLMFLLYVW